eukprot:4223950-Amphidinium_carterae.1
MPPGHALTTTQTSSSSLAAHHQLQSAHLNAQVGPRTLQLPGWFPRAIAFFHFVIVADTRKGCHNDNACLACPPCRFPSNPTLND